MRTILHFQTVQGQISNWVFLFTWFRKCFFSQSSVIVGRSYMRQMKDTLKLAVLYTLHFSSSTSFRERRLQDSVFTNTYASFTFSTKFSHEFIKIMHSLDSFPFAQLSDITPQYLLRSHLLQHGLELLHPWQTVSVLDPNTPLVNYVCFPFFSSLFSSQVWLNYVLRDVLWQTASPREVHFICLWKWAAAAVKWLIFLSSSTTQPPPRFDTQREMRKFGSHGGRREGYSLKNLFKVISHFY